MPGKRYSKQELSGIRKAALLKGYPTMDRETGEKRIHKEPPIGRKYEPWVRNRKRKTLGILDERAIRTLQAMGRSK